MRYKAALPYIAVAVTVFLAVLGAFVCHGIFTAKNGAATVRTSVADFMQRNILIAVQDSAANTLDTNLIVSFDPKDNTIKTITIPSDTRVKIASSDQMLRDVMNIGGIDMLRDIIGSIVPLPIDYHLIIKSEELLAGDNDYSSLINFILSEYLWQQSDLSGYLNRLLSVANTDLTLMRTEEYANFIWRFTNHTNHHYTVPGVRTAISGKTFYVTDSIETNELINTEILN